MENAFLDNDTIDAMPYQSLRAECKRRKLSAKGQAGVLRSRLKQYHAEQDVEHLAPESAEQVMDEQTLPGIRPPAPAMSAAQEESVAVPVSKQFLSRPESQEEPAVEDTAGSTEQSPRATQIHSKLAAAGATPLPADFRDTEATSFGQSLSNFEGDLASDATDCQLPPAADGEISTSHVKEKVPHVSGMHQSLQQQPKWLWLLLPLFLTLFGWFVVKQQGGSHISFSGPKCNQLMRFESLAPMLAHAHTRSHLADVWSGETRDPHKAGGVILACPDSNVSRAATAAVVSSLSPSCGHCLQHFDMPQFAAVGRAGQGSDLAGQAQKSLVRTLQGCSHAVVVVEGIDSTPPALLPVFINALSEHGHFEHDGKQVPAYNALVVATIALPTGNLEQAPEEKIENSVKEHMVHELTAGTSSKDVTRATALRRRFEHVALLLSRGSLQES